MQATMYATTNTAMPVAPASRIQATKRSSQSLTGRSFRAARSATSTSPSRTSRPLPPPREGASGEATADGALIGTPSCEGR